MLNPDRHQVATTDLIYDTIEDQVIMLDIQTGTYFQLTGNAVPAWNWLVSGIPLTEIVNRFAKQYPNNIATIETGVTNFVRELTAEKLLKPLETEPVTTDTANYPLTADETFVTPTLLKYTDMQSLLLLDPIHDVDTPGWPITSAENAA